MLLGLAVAVLLALMLQLNALRARRAEAFECASDGVIHLKAWVVLETSPDAEFATFAVEAVRQVLMLPGRVAKVIKRRLSRPHAKWALGPAELWRELWTPAARPAAATGPPISSSSALEERWRSPWLPNTSPSAQRPPAPRRALPFSLRAAAWSRGYANAAPLSGP
jgi:hypothetical protein